MMISHLLFFVWTLALTSLASASVPTPASPATNGVTLPRTSVESLTAADGTRYTIYVSLPRSYAKESQRYPVAYLLDAEYSFGIVRNLVEHLSDRNDLPELMVVAVAYPGGIEGDDWLRRYRLQRTRDYTPTFSKIGYPDGIQDVSGGGQEFLEFIRDRLVPFVEQRFRASPSDRTIVGHSYGGLFAGFAALSNPDLFPRAIMISPSLWYDDRFLFRYEQSRRKSLENHSLRLFLAAGSREGAKSSGNIAGDVKKFADLFKTPDYKAARASSVIFADETHNSVFPGAVTRGLLEVFGDSQK